MWAYVESVPNKKMDSCILRAEDTSHEHQHDGGHSLGPDSRREAYERLEAWQRVLHPNLSNRSMYPDGGFPKLWVPF